MESSRPDGGRDLHHFLMTPLHRAVALVQMQDIAVVVAQDLHFDVARAADVALQEDGVVAEGGAGLAPRLFQQACEIGRALHHAHAAPAAAERGLNDQREADAGARFARLSPAFGPAARCPAPRGCRCGSANCRAGGLVAQQFEQFGAGTDESDARARRRRGPAPDFPRGTHSPDEWRRHPSPPPAPRCPRYRGMPPPAPCPRPTR